MASANYYTSGGTVEVWLEGLATHDNGVAIQWTRRVNWTLTNVTTGNGRQADYYVDISPGNVEGGDYTFQNIPSGTYNASARITDAATGKYVTTLSTGSFTVSGSGGDSGGGSVDSQWTPHIQDIIDMTDLSVSSTGVDIYNPQTGRYQLEEYAIHIFPVEFAQSGYAHFYTESNIDTKGYLSNSYKCDSEGSEPLYILASDDDLGSGNNFDIKHYVTAGTYYIFVRGYSGEETGDVVLYVTQPWELNSSSYGTLSDKTESISVSRPYTLYRRTVYFSKSGKVTISTSGGSGLRGWLGTSSEWDYGQPTSYISPVSASSGFFDFSNSYNVVAGQVYYVWVAPTSINTGYTFKLNISSEEENTVSKWSWSASNGSASASQTSASYSAIVNKQDTRNFSHLVWNDLVSKVGDILDAKGLSWDSTYASYDNTKATLNANGEYELTAKMFNSLRNNLELAGYGYLGLSKIPDTTDHDEPPSGKIPHPVNSNKRVFGHYFTTLATYINSCIDKL